MKDYIILFFMSSFLGWILEYIYNKNNINYCGDTIKINICLPLYIAYGIFAILLLYFKDYLKDFNTIQLLLLFITFIALFECIIGKISFMINNKKTWDYSYDVCHGFVFCDGYVSLLSSVGFGFIATLYYELVIKKYF